eukprot:CAMPEP_0180801760 /NCGR_PEP_ID=MMETSP1038_2-20121128/59855_1 /TAXON_ID=632150 /ORGANISM="Azadinium spinosum, Strain 3D9" /LENGTH=60 /DNA_ID=CAMNT_0022841669 /DNA_START=1 /DNA_END=183 /DNA_ORIENTATION=-
MLIGVIRSSGAAAPSSALAEARGLIDTLRQQSGEFLCHQAMISWWERKPAVLQWRDQRGG